MTRALVFLAATLVAASLGGVTQESSTASKQGSSPTLQSSTDNRVPSEATSDTRTAAANTANQSSSQAAAANDSAQVPRTGGTAKGVEDPAPGEDPAIPKNNAQLPQTSTILPLLGLIGLGSLVAGLFARR